MKILTIMRSMLKEAFINCKTSSEMREYGPIVWKLLQSSYAKIGGYKGVASIDELISDSQLWKLVRKNGKIVACCIYKDIYGRKSIASATDGTDIGKQALMTIWTEDLKLNRSWSEVSGAAAHIKTKMGYKPIPNKYAADILKKDIRALNPDGIHYTRLIGGVEYEKMIVGNVNGYNI